MEEMNTKVSIIGCYSHAHPEQKMIDRIDNAVKVLKSNNIDLNFVGYVVDHDESSIEMVKKNLLDTLNGSSSILIIISGWVESPFVLRVIEDYLHLPVIVWSLAGYYAESGLISPASAAGASLLGFTLRDLKVKHVTIYQNVGEELNKDEVISYINFFGLIKKFKSMKVVSVGYACSNLYPFMYDGNIIKRFTGIHVDNMDLLEVKMVADNVSNSDISSFVNSLNKIFCSDLKNSKEEMEILARYSIALDKIVSENGYEGITLKCGSGFGKFFNFAPCMILSYIGDKVEAICECDVYGLIAQLIIRKLTGTKAMFLEFFEFYKKSILMASCGFAPFSLCKGDCVKVYKRYWGSTGGLMNISDLETGKISLVNLSVRSGQMHMHLVTGNAKTPENFQEEGWEEGRGPKIPSLEVELDGDIKEFQDNISGPHYIVAYGDITKVVKMYCMFTGIRFNEY
jgi:L-fucose isomerase-like protein